MANKIKAKKIQRFFKKYKFIVNLVIILLGIIIVLVGVLPPNMPTDVESILMNVGVSIVSSGIVALIALLIQDEDDEDDDVIKSWGLIKIYETRSEQNSQTALEFPVMKQRYDQIAFGVKSLRDAKGGLFEEKVKHGLKIRFITMNPDSIYLQEREREENKTVGEIRKTILDLIEWIKKLQKLSKHKSNIQIKFYDTLPLDYYCRIDDNLYVGPYLHAKESQQTISYKFNPLSKGFTYYTDYFESIWNDNNFLKSLEEVDLQLNENN